MAAISLSAASSVMLGLEDAGREAFESQVRARSTRRHDATFAVGYYISPRLLRELNERVASQQRSAAPIKAAALQRIVQAPRNARLFKRTSLNLHERVDNVILAESEALRPQSLTKNELDRLRQVAKAANDRAFCERLRRLPSGGDQLLECLHQLLVSLTAQYAGRSSNDDIGTIHIDARSDRIALQDNNDRAAPAPHDSICREQRLVSSSSTRLSSLRASHSLFPLRQIQNATLAHLKSETSVQRAYAISQRDEHAFTAYRVFFTNDATGLATEIARRCKDKNPPQMVLKWISAWIGPVPTVVSHEVDSSGRSSSRSYTTETTLPTCELRHLALVAAALTLYGEHVLAALYAHDSSMGGVKDIPLLSEELRHPRKQRECLQRARWRSKRPARVLHAAHYLPLDLTIQWNNALAPALRLSASDLAWILNHPSNLKAVPHRVNTRDHRKVEHFVAAFIRHAHDEHVPARLKTTSWLAWRNTRDRLAHIARRVQSLELQSALLQANGHALYALIRETFERIDRVFAARGLDFGAIWVASDSSSRVSERVRMPALPHSTCDGDVESETACPC